MSPSRTMTTRATSHEVNKNTDIVFNNIFQDEDEEWLDTESPFW